MTDHSAGVGLIGDVPMERLMLGTRARNALDRAGIKTVDDIQDATLTEVAGIGATSAREIEDALDSLLSLAQNGVVGEELDLRVPVGDADDTVLQLVRKVAEAVATEDPDDRGFQVFARHHGLIDGESFTLEEIGGYFGVSRERARQLEERLWDRVRSVLRDGTDGVQYRVPEVVRSRLLSTRGDLAERYGSIVRREDIVATVHPEKGPPSRAEQAALGPLMDAWGYEPLSDVRGCQLWCVDLTESEKQEILDTISAIDDVLLEAPGPLATFTLVVRVGRTVGHPVPPERVQVLLDLMPHVSEVDPDRYEADLASLPSMAHMARRLLAKEGSPLHFREIARRINKVSMEAKGSRRVSSLVALSGQLSGSDWFRAIGKSGSWALTEWENVRTEPVVELMEEAFSARQEAASAAEIHEYVAQFRPEIPVGTIRTLMTMRDDLFVRVGRGRYELTAWGGKPSSKSVRSSSAITEVLKEVLLGLVEERGERSIPLAEAVRQIVERSDLPESTVRSRLSRAEWADTEGPANGRKDLLVDVEALQLVRPGRDREAPVRRRVEESIRSFLASQPSGRATAIAIWKHVTDDAGVNRPSVYAALEDMDGVRKVREGGQLFVVLEGFSKEHRIELPGLETMPMGDLRDAVLSAQANLTLENVDIGLFQLGKIFEGELRSLLIALQAAGHLEVSEKDLSSLYKMIDAVVAAGEIKEVHHLTLLREERNARAHGGVPSKADRQGLLADAPYLGKLYMTYIIQISERRRAVEASVHDG